MPLLVIPFAFGYYISYLLRTVNAVVSPSLTSELALSASDLGLLTSAYFIGFGLAQIPVGVALDRFGPRKVEGTLLLVAAAGSAIFAIGKSPVILGGARFLIGAGVSACLMSAVKGISLWYPKERQGSMTGFVMSAGAFGALSASKPIEQLMPFLGWRGMFFFFTAATIIAAIVIFRKIPEHHVRTEPSTINDIFRRTGSIIASRQFFKFAPSVTFFPGGFMALQSLWAVPWMMNVEGMPLSEAAFSLMFLNGGMMTGQLCAGFFTTALVTRGFKPIYIMRTGYGLFIVAELAILFSIGPQILLWFLVGMFSASNSQTFTASSEGFPPEMMGRVVTTFNLMSFIGAFIVQWGMGLLLDTLQMGGHTLKYALTFSFAILISIQFISHLFLYKKN